MARGRSLTRAPLWLAALPLTACVGSGEMPSVEAASPNFAPIAFFAGPTEGLGRLRVALSSGRSVRVTGQGTVGPDGALTLVQRIDQENSPERSRTWSLRPTGGGTYEGTLSDAVGPVTAIVEGRRLHIRFRTKGGVAVEQWLVLSADGRVARNHLIARKLGVRVAVLDETIRKID